ncbi:MAG: hypothetical protein WBB26_09795 [Saprospiraceae bacterium]
MNCKILLGFIVLICFSTCLPEDMTKYSLEDKHIKIAVKDTNNEIIINWDKVKGSSFNEYIITRNTNSTKAAKFLMDIDPSTIIGRFSDKEISSMKEKSGIGQAYYRLYVLIENQIFSSDEIYYKFQNLILKKGKLKQHLLDKRNGYLYIIYESKLIEKINLSTFQIENSIEKLNYFFSPQEDNHCSLSYDSLGNTEIYMPIKNKIHILDANMKLKFIFENLNVFNNVIGTATDNMGNIYFLETSNLSSTVYKLDRSSLNLISMGNSFYPLKFIMASEDGSKIVAHNKLMFDSLNVYTPIPTGQIFPHIIGEYDSRNCSIISNDGNIMIFGPLGQLNFYGGKYQLEMFAFSDYTFFSISDDNRFIYSSSEFIKEINIILVDPPFKRFKSRACLSVPFFHFYYNNKIYIIGDYVDPISKEYYNLLEKIDL